MKSEAQEQKVIIQWCNLQSCKYPELKMIFHCPNESKRSARYGAECFNPCFIGTYSFTRNT